MNTEHPSIIRLNELDNVGVTLVDLASGDPIGVDNLMARVPIAAGHKVAIRNINTQDPVLKFGQIIGFAANPIEPGDHVHTHNLEIPATTISVQTFSQPGFCRKPSGPNSRVLYGLTDKLRHEIISGSWRRSIAQPVWLDL
jgi:hypothetical protein